VYWTAAILREAITRFSAPRAPRLGAWTAWAICLVVAAAVLVRLGPMAIVRTIVVTIIGNIIGFVAGPAALFLAELGLEVLGSTLIVIAGFVILRIVGSRVAPGGAPRGARRATAHRRLTVGRAVQDLAVHQPCFRPRPSRGAGPR
jgi:hypothetical protein